MFKPLLIALMGITVLSGCQSSEQSVQSSINGQAEINSAADVERIKAHIAFLADDRMAGRDTGSAEHEIASMYIASQLAQYGVKPAGDDGTFYQRITFRQANLVQESPKLTLSKNGDSVELDYPSQFITGPSTMNEQSEVSGDLVFVGYGIVAPELNHDDYAGLNVEGKIVVILSGKPASFPTEEGAHFSSGREKARYAAERGAIGSISVSTPTSEKVRPYQRSLNFLHAPRISWLDKNGVPANVQPTMSGIGRLSPSSAEMLFEGAQRSLEDIYADLEKDLSPKGFALDYSVNFSKQSTHNEITSPNVVGVIEGSDPKLKNEYVVYSAHSDHIGISKSVKEDRINNGAMDNASGTAIMLETARLFANQAAKPKRSVLFVAVTAEEKGLLGSDYFARNPTVPVGSMVANVNLDMPLLTHEFQDLIAFGLGHSDLKESASAATAKIGMELSPDPWPNLNLFTRSDHYSFVKQGVPALFLFPGLQSADPEMAEGKAFNMFMAKHYHQPSDDLNLPFSWVAAKRFTEVNFQIGNTIANQAQKPKWNDDSFFGNTFGK